MGLDRRTFLKAAAAAPCIFGLREIFAQEPDARPEWFKQALARMKERKLHGMVVIAPRSEEEQLALGRQLWDLLEGDFPEVHELLLTSVFVVMTPALAEASGVRKADETEDRFVLDPEGRRVAADTRDAKAFDTAAGFVASFGPFLHGNSWERLKARADELEKAAREDVPAALRKLGSEEIEEREWASGILLAWADKMAPLYAWKRRTATDPEVVARLKSVVERHFHTLAPTVQGAQLPFGTRTPRFTNGGCGRRREVLEIESKDSEEMVACGMARIDDSKVRMFLRFLTK